jgi:hypothetical protein
MVRERASSPRRREAVEKSRPWRVEETMGGESSV